jgi:hypothetical protein
LQVCASFNQRAAHGQLEWPRNPTRRLNRRGSPRDEDRERIPPVRDMNSPIAGAQRHPSHTSSSDQAPSSMLGSARGSSQ